MIFLAILSGILVGLSIFLVKYLTSDKYTPATYLFVFSLISTIACFPVLLLYPTLPTSFTPWFWLAVTTGSFVVANVSLITACQLEDISNISIVIKASIVLSVLSGIFLFDEPVTTKIVFGLILVSLGIILIFVKRLKIRSIKGLALSFLAGLAYTSSAIGSKYSLPYFNQYSYMFFPYLGVTICTALFPKVLQEAKSAFLETRNVIIIKQLLGIVGYFLYLIVINRPGGLSVGNTIEESLEVLVPVLIGILFLKEKSSLKNKLIGSIMIIIGIIFISQ